MCYEHTFSPGLKKALVNPDKPFAFGLPSSEAVLQADNITISELSFIFLFLKR